MSMSSPSNRRAKQLKEQTRRRNSRAEENFIDEFPSDYVEHHQRTMSGSMVVPSFNEDLNYEDEDDTSVNKMGEVVFKGHKSYNLMRDVQMGVRIVVGGVHSKPSPKCLLTQDFAKRIKLDFPAKGSYQTPAHEFTDFQFKDYAPNVFRSLRDCFGIDPGDYMLSLCGDGSLSMLGTPGKSGALFFFSENMRYIIKTVTKKEARSMKLLLLHYYNYVAANPDTLLVRFFGLHRIKPTGGRVVRFIVMNNVFNTHLKIHEKYDLKGSTVDRAASEKDRQKKDVILKDLDINTPIYLGKEKTRRVVDQLMMDSKFLADNGLMDYSLLLGIHRAVNEEDTLATELTVETNIQPSEPCLSEIPTTDTSSQDTRRHSCTSSIASEISSVLSMKAKGWAERRIKKKKTEQLSLFQQDFGGAISTYPDPGKVYFFGIIDILQKWNTRKQFEQFFKSFKYEKSDISVAHPQRYAKRFQIFMKNLFQYEEECNT